jgi:hypothetical protein
MTRSHRLALSLALVLAGTPAVAAQAPPATQAPAAATSAQPAAPLALALEGPTALVFHVVKADRGPEFEQLFARLTTGLAASSVEARRQQAEGWRLLKQNAPTPEGHLVYVSVIEPVVANQEYDMARLLAEMYPDEGLSLYQTLLAVHVQPSVQASNLAPVGTAPTSSPEAQP